MVGNAFSAVIKWNYAFDLPKTKLFTSGKYKLAKYMVYTLFQGTYRNCYSISYQWSSIAEIGKLKSSIEHQHLNSDKLQLQKQSKCLQRTCHTS
jgi:hypothetical protein